MIQGLLVQGVQMALVLLLAPLLTGLVRKSLDGVEAEAPLAMEAANA